MKESHSGRPTVRGLQGLRRGEPIKPSCNANQEIIVRLTKIQRQRIVSSYKILETMEAGQLAPKQVEGDAKIIRRMFDELFGTVITLKED